MGMVTADAAPDAAIAPNSSSRWARPSVRYGMIGATMTFTANPASASARTRSSRARGAGVPGSSCRCKSGSRIAIETASRTSTSRAARLSSGRSRRNRVPLVRMENGVPASVSARMMPGINRYRPSAR
ncbi:Uncharacterised protein [Mycobacteroides abscessus subsp. abscessus]|nr:Uncharacterised protein [Mycobacteroides abscessus subsp. abscessus]